MDKDKRWSESLARAFAESGADKDKYLNDVAYHALVQRRAHELYEPERAGYTAAQLREHSKLLAVSMGFDPYGRTRRS